MASAEMGVKWKIGNRNALYTGIYADYGFNNIQKTNDKTFVQSALSAENPPMSPMVEAGFTDKITPLAEGLKIRFAFGAGKNFQKQAQTAKEEITVIEKVSENPPYIVDNTDKEDAARKEAEEKAEAERLANSAKEQEKTRLQIVINSIQQPVENYEMSATWLTAAQRKEVDKQIALLKQYPDMKVFIYGHTCDLGTPETNEKVGLGRAEKAKEYMISKGISEKRIAGIASKLDREPLVPNTSEENRKKNRRVEIVVQ
jgi:outer membrane protein OmpA-like peptidoglycan-associated protein